MSDRLQGALPYLALAMNRLGAVRAAGVTLLFPVTAVFWGALLLHDAHPPLVAGMAVILVGTAFPNSHTPADRAPAGRRDLAAA